MNWYLRVRVESGVPWPTKETVVKFRERELTLCPETAQLAPTVLLAYERGRLTDDQALQLVRHFLSSLSWAEGRPIRDLESVGGSHPIRIGKGGGASVVSPNFRADYLPDPADPKAKLALALYREAHSANSVAYGFLGFFKILNVRFPNGTPQIDWINQVIDQLPDTATKTRVAELRAAGKDVGDYLYTSGRCAVAHAWTEPIADPDDPETTRRLLADLPVIQALAERVIEREMGVKSHATIWREHLYELRGFHELVGEGIVARIKRGERLPAAEIPALPRLSLRVRDQKGLEGFEGLVAEVADVVDGRLVLKIPSADGIVIALLQLDFAHERLIFEPFEHLAIRDDGSSKAVRYGIEALSLQRALTLNGQLEVWHADSGELLGRTDPHIPINIDLSGTLRSLDAEVTRLKEEEQRRLEQPGG